MRVCEHAVRGFAVAPDTLVLFRAPPEMQHRNLPAMALGRNGGFSCWRCALPARV